MGKIKPKRKNVKKVTQFRVINPYAAGIDVSSTEMVVAYPVSSNELQIRSFGCFTSDLHSIVACLKENKITSVAMESTGVYYISLFLMLQEHGFEVYLVNAKHVKNVTGRKTDESDAEWIQKLHSCGLLNASFQPDNLTRTLRCFARHRKNLIRSKSMYTNRMQKAMELMNIKLHTVISDIDGKTGIRIIEAILSGERNPEVLADMRDGRIKASREEIVKSLEGHWTPEHLFELQQCYKLYCWHRDMIQECDIEIETQLKVQIASMNEGVIPEIAEAKRKHTSNRNKYTFNATSYLNEILGVNITEIAGISEITALTILSEVGTDMTKWKTEHHFTSWLGLAPNTKVSGGKVISSRIKKKKHNTAEAFRLAAGSLYNNKGPLGDFYRRIRAKAGPAKANVATARKLAIIFYKMVLNKEPYNPAQLEDYQKKYKEKKINQLRRKLAALEAA